MISVGLVQISKFVRLPEDNYSRYLRSATVVVKSL